MKKNDSVGALGQELQYPNPMFWDRQVRANSADPDPNAPESQIRVYNVCHSFCSFWTHKCMLKLYW